MKKNSSLLTLLFLNVFAISRAMHKEEKEIEQLAIMKQFLPDTTSIETIKKTIDDIEHKRLGYQDYAQRTGIIWSDVWVNTKQPIQLEECNETIKVTQVMGELANNNPQSIFTYPAIASIFSNEILPKTFEAIKTWTPLREKVFAQIFLQRCSTSDPMDWHQDPGEEGYEIDSMADYSLVYMLSNQDDPEHGWIGGKFKVKPGLPSGDHDKKDVRKLIHCYNQAILFNNKLNSHAVTKITADSSNAQRDLIVIAIYLTKPPVPLPCKSDAANLISVVSNSGR
jgi:hypothetical protein